MTLKLENLYNTVIYVIIWRVGDKRVVNEKDMNVNLYEIDYSADLGGSSKYSSENLEDRSRERFHENSVWSWVSRS